MAKTESTAVNSLIDLVQSNQAKPIIDPDEDLFAAPRPAAKQPAIPSLRGGTVPPLPRSRAPGGTSQLTLPEHQAAVRTTTAPPSRGTTIPPIPRVAKTAEGTPPPTISARPSGGALPPPALSARPSGGALPPPARPSAPAPARPSPVPAQARATMPSPSTGSKRAPSPAAGVPKRAASPSPKEIYAKAQTGPAGLISQARIDMTGDMVRGDDWFEQSRAVEKFEDETYVGTSPHVLQDRRSEASLVKKLILPGIGFIIVGALIGGFIALNSNGKKKVVAKAPAPQVTAANQPTAENAAIAAQIAHGANTGVPAAPTAEHVAAAVPVVGEEVQTTRGVVHLTDVRIDSMPSGATVTLVEQTPAGEKKSFLGTTPIATSIDPSHTYDVVLSLQGHPDQTAKLDPAHAPHLQIALGKAGRTAPVAQPAIAKATPAPHAAPVVKAPRHSAPPKTEQLADPGFDSTPAPAAPAPEAPAVEKPAAAAGASGTLMISSKPPCEIEIDGKSTGLRTPQRAITLPAGAHKVTLVNSDASVNKTLMVQINAGQSTKLVKDLTGN